ncbi:MAG TPA: hypothetical protein VGL82_20160 [Bryobacteraceae bacterium]|jgi:hypothetical protein
MNISKSVVLTILMFSLPAFADISVGYLSILSDSPTPGEQELTINNLTGPGNCYSSYPACTNLDFTNWTLTVNYTGSYYNGSGPVEPSPFVYTSATYGDITPGSTNNVFDFDLCGGVYPCANLDSPITTITSIEFSGQISPSSFCLFDPSANGCAANPTTFFADPNFDLVWNGGSPQLPLVDEDLNPYAQSPDITVTDQSTSTGTVTPEPDEFFPLVAFAALLPFAWFVRRRNRSIKSDTPDPKISIS